MQEAYCKSCFLVFLITYSLKARKGGANGEPWQGLQARKGEGGNPSPRNLSLHLTKAT